MARIKLGVNDLREARTENERPARSKDGKRMARIKLGVNNHVGRAEAKPCLILITARINKQEQRMKQRHDKTCAHATAGETQNSVRPRTLSRQQPDTFSKQT